MTASSEGGVAAAGVIDPSLPDVTLDDIRMDGAEADLLKGMSVWRRMVLSYQDMRTTTRALIDENPSETRLLFFVLLSDVVFFLSRGVALVIAPGSATSERLPMEIGLWLVAALFLRTATLYGFSAMVAAVCRLLGGTGSWRDTRAAVFWASLVAAPIGVLGALVVAAFAHLERLVPAFGSEMLALPPQWIGVVAFVFFLSAGVAEAHRFRNTSPVFMTFSALTVLLSLGGIFVYVRYVS